MTKVASILAALRDGPKTNRQLQDVVEDHGAGVARTLNKLMKSGRVARIDAGRGAGTRAVYGLPPEKPG